MMAGGRQHGLNLIEATVTMAVLSMLLAAGWPGLAEVVARHRVVTVTHLLSGHLASARSLAIGRQVTMAVCPSLDGRRCSNDSDWSQGWIIYRESSTSGVPAAAGSVIHHARPASGRRITLLSSPGRPRLRFLPDGRSAGSNLSVSVCHGDRQRAEVVVNNLGRIRSRRIEDARPCPWRTGPTMTALSSNRANLGYSAFIALAELRCPRYPVRSP